MSIFQNTCKPEGFLGRVMVSMMNSGHCTMAKWGFSNINIFESAYVLDIGCGGGANIANWLKKCKKGYVIGMDYSKVSVNASASKNKKAIQENRCNVILGNVIEMPFENKQFDVVSAFETIYFWPELQNSFLEVYRVLKTGGQFLICNESDGMNIKDEKWTTMIKGMTIYNEGEISKLLLKSGFKNLRIKHTKGHWICIVCEK